jgi:hypothetical protein
LEDEPDVEVRIAVPDPEVLLAVLSGQSALRFDENTAGELEVRGVLPGLLRLHERDLLSLVLDQEAPLADLLRDGLLQPAAEP